MDLATLAEAIQHLGEALTAAVMGFGAGYVAAAIRERPTTTRRR